MKLLRLVPMLLLVGDVFAAPPHDVAVPCDGGTANFYGGVISGIVAPGEVKLDWTVFEDGTVRQYRLSRHLSSPASAASVPVARVNAGRDQPATRAYAFVDTAPPGAWVYRLDVQRTRGLSCYMETGEVIVPALPPCDTAALCAQVEASFAGSVVVGAALPGPPQVHLQWLTHAETPAVNGYRLSRFDCADPRACSVDVATVFANGSCGQVMRHSVIDAPPAGTWTYVLEVMDSGGRAACALRLPAPAAPASSR